MLTVIKFSALTVIPIYIIMLTLNIYNVKIHFSDSKTVKLKTECEERVGCGSSRCWPGLFSIMTCPGSCPRQVSYADQ